MEYLMISILSAISLFVVIRPLTHSIKEEDTIISTQNLSNIRATIYHEMDLLRLDHELGLIETEQYKEQIHQFRIQLASIVIAESNS